MFNNIVHVNALAKYVDLWLENEKPDFEHDYFNVGASEPMRLEMVAQTLMEGLGSSVLIQEVSRGRRLSLLISKNHIKTTFQ